MRLTYSHLDLVALAFFALCWFGYGWVIRTHEVATWVLFALIPLHVGGVIHAARVHRENLVAAMLHGRKPAAAGDDVPP